jgi:hypothetical protein
MLTCLPVCVPQGVPTEYGVLQVVEGVSVESGCSDAGTCGMCTCLKEGGRAGSEVVLSPPTTGTVTLGREGQEEFTEPVAIAL